MTKKTYTFAEAQEAARAHDMDILPPPSPKPKKANLDRGVSELRKAIEAKNRKTRKATTAASEAPRELRKVVHYVRSGGAEEFNVRIGEWLPRDAKYWEFQSRQATLAQVLEVHDVEGPTVIDHPTHGRIVARGCLICGVRDVIRPTSPVRFGGWRGSMCPEHHTRWEALSVAEKRQLGLFVARQLWSAERLPEGYPTDATGHGVHPIQSWPENWRRYTWGYRVLTSKSPEKQEPGSEPFFFLAPGRLSFAEGAEPQEVTA